MIYKRNLTDQELSEITKKRLLWEEDWLKKTNVKWFDMELATYNKYFSGFKKNPKLKNIMSELNTYVDTLDKWYEMNDLDKILDKYLADFKENFPKTNSHENQMTELCKYSKHLKRALIKLYKNSKETNCSLFMNLKDTSKNTEEEVFYNENRNPELTYLFYLFIIKLSEEA